MKLWKNFERAVKLLRGKDIEVKISDEVMALVEAASNLIEREAIELVKSGAEKGWEAIQANYSGVITREQYDSFVRSIVDAIIELGGDK